MNIRNLAFRNVLGAASSRSRSSQAAVSAQTVVVGGKGFTEQQLIAELTSQLLAANGFKPDKRVGMGTAVLRQALDSGQIDVCWEYTGTALSNVYKDTEKYTAEQGYEKIRSLDAAKGIVWLKPTRVNNSYGIGMLRAKSRQARHQVDFRSRQRIQEQQDNAHRRQRRILAAPRRPCRACRRSTASPFRSIRSSRWTSACRSRRCATDRSTRRW